MHKTVKKWDATKKKHVFHNDNDSPSFITFYKNGNTKKEIYYKNGFIHRMEGPAVIEYDKSGNITKESYFIEGSKLTKREFNFWKLKRIILNTDFSKINY
jgi:antitoxin component YwqK of YwqJK toxin-antitoxin module